MSNLPRISRSLRALAVDHGVVLDHVDGLGVQRDPDPEVVLAILRALGTPIDSPTQAGTFLRARRRTRAAQVVDPVVVVDEQATAVVVVRVAPGTPDLDCALEDEGGTRIEWRVRLDELTDVRTEPYDGRDVVVAGVPLPGALRAGYHTFSVRVRGRSHAATVVVTPAAGARGRFASDWRAFGVVAPLFALHSARSWGSGDLGDLDEFGAFLAGRQATVVSTLPLLAGAGPEDFEASPYLPSSREFWHERWVDVERIPDLAWSASARGLVSGRGAIDRSQLVTGGLVDGAATVRAKRRVLHELAAAVGATPAREAALRTFVLERPIVVEYARFRAAGERFGPDWRRWPAAARDGLLRWSDVDPALEREFIYTQWVLHEQMHELAQRCAARGQTLALDLPIGVDARGFDAWRHRDQYAVGMAIGAPPDGFFTRGQSWGTPPPLPDAVRADGHRSFRAAVAHHLRVAGLLRIDHIMGLQRLFWVPDGAEPAAGLYVQMPMDELFGVLAIEAQRFRADIVGEDLGTVDPAVRAAMDRLGVRRSHVAQFGLRPGHDPVVEPAPPGSVASFATHDLPPIAAWCAGTDIDERADFDQIDAAGAAAAHADRAELVHAVANAAGVTDGDAAATAAGVLDRVHADLGDGDAGLVLVQLDDLVGETHAVNLPGTSTERANWQRRSRLSLEAIVHDPAVRERLAPLARRRGQDAVRSGNGRRRPPETVFGVTRFDPDDLRTFAQGRHHRLHDKLGAHPMVVDGVAGTYFAVWAPNAERVRLIGDWNDWDGERHPLAPVGETGVWEGFVAGVGPGQRYKFRIRSRLGGADFDKADPFARHGEIPPLTASTVWSPAHEWGDADWMRRRPETQGLGRPMSIYEVHLGSWRRVPEDGNRSLTYRELAPRLVEHVRRHGFTHVELLPIMEHPFYGSWGYQTTGYFSPTARHGDPDDFAALVDELHRHDIGVILDWVPSHFPSDAFALAEFDGTHLFEHADPRQRVHPDWQSWIFNYSRNEVRSILVSSACYWLEHFHIDGLRLDAVASMLYLDYSRRPGEWVPNRHGGNENLEAVQFLQECNTEIYRSFPDVVTIAEESTAWPGVSRPVHAGGLGFGYKWDMGWMHDTLAYLAHDPIHRSWHHDTLTFRAMYADTEHFVLPLSHDEVVHGKGSLLAKMPGDDWQRRANLRLLFGYQFTVPGKKLLFMGAELGQWTEWDHESSLDWHLLDDPAHAGIAAWVARLNELYRTMPALHQDDRVGSFAWIDCDDREQSVVAYERWGRDPDDVVVVIANFTPVPRPGRRVGVARPGTWTVVADSDAGEFGGSGMRSPSTLGATSVAAHGRAQSVVVDVPPLGLLVLRPTPGTGA